MKRIHTLNDMKPHRKLLRGKMTKAEVRLWFCIKNKKLGYQFYRQHSIGGYIVDFYCPEKKFVIELDGEYHEFQKEYDQRRTDYLNSSGCRVMRFLNSEIENNLVGVVTGIEYYLRE